MRRHEIAMVTAVSPRAGARIALRRFETARPVNAPSPRIAPRKGSALAEQCFGPATGPRVLLLHGWNAHSAMMLPLARMLAAQGAHVVVPDLPGEGANPARAFSFAEKACRLAAHYEGDRFDAIIGHSAGGLIAAQAVEQGLQADSMITVCAPYSMATLLHAYLIRIAAPEPLLDAVLDLHARREDRDPKQVGPAVYAAYTGRILIVHARTDWQVKLAEAFDIASVTGATPLVLDHCNHHTILEDPRLHAAISDAVLTPTDERRLAC
ncbi:hypothetical protein CFI11_00335 [Thalassococcus sp. S3]|nr:hypothetical protein CFI11_00335 [Thalassococcus sp. S3]